MPGATPSMISEEFLEEISKRFKENKVVRRSLPGGGLLHIDRRLPFLCVYRQPPSGNDSGTRQLVKSEASYLIASDAVRAKKDIARLVESIVNTFSGYSGAFLIIELWTDKAPIPILDPEKGRTAPSFKIQALQSRVPDETIVSLEKTLKRITVSGNRARVSAIYSSRSWPEGLSTLISAATANRLNCYLVGIEIAPIFRDPESSEVYPLVLKKIQKGLSVALKQGAYEFVRKRTNAQPGSYKSLGRRAVVKSVWEVDRQLAEISSEIDFLLLITPVNIEQSWQKFRRERFIRPPTFFYRPVPFDPLLLKRKLFEIPVDKIEDPALSSIFNEKIIEIELMISMVRDRKTRDFYYGSLQLYGEPDKELIELSKQILTSLSPRSRERGGKYINAIKFAERAREEIESYKRLFPEIASKVVVRNDITGLLVSHGNLHVGQFVKIPESRMEALIQHEVGTHILTYINGKNQPFRQLYSGLAGNDELQEGLAVLAEYLVGGLSSSRLRLLAGRVLAAHYLVEGATFLATFRDLHDTFGFSQRISYIITSRIYRSGGLTKDAVYLRGFVKLIEYLRKGGDLETLFVGKFSLGDIPVIKELQLRKVLKPELLLPQYLQDEEAKQRFLDLKQGKRIYNII